MVVIMILECWPNCNGIDDDKWDDMGLTNHCVGPSNGLFEINQWKECGLKGFDLYGDS